MEPLPSEHLLQQVQEKLRESEERFRNMFFTAAIGIAVSTPEGRFLHANPAYCRMLGYTEAELQERTFMSLTHPDDLPLNLTLRDELLAGQRAGFILEKRYLRKGGDTLWTRHSVSATHAPRGEIATLMVVAENISERKRAEEALALFRHLIDRSPDAIEVIDPETRRFLDVNQTGCERLGYSREEMLALTIADIDLDNADPALWPGLLERIRRSGSATVMGRHRRKDGSIFPVEVSVRYLELKRAYIVAVVRDITSRKQLEARYRRLADSNIQGVMFWQAQGRIIDGNDAFLKLVGYTREDLAAGRIDWLAMTPAEYRKADLRAQAELASSGVGRPLETEWIRKDGSRVPILIGAATFEDNPEEGVCFVVDLTERKRLEQQFLRAQRMESVGTLAGGVAHDLNNILTPIMMSISILKQLNQSPEAREVLETIDVSAKRGAEIVRQVLSFARGLEGQRVEIQPKHLLRDMEHIIRSTFPRDIDIHFKVARELWTIAGDPTQVHQILLNLCVNARDAMPQGGRLNIGVENFVVDEHFAAANPPIKPGRYVKFNVTDTGTGIAPDIINKIYEPFFTTKEANKGTGLGLSTVMAIVKSHEGHISVYSVVGEGTTFNVYLPAAQASSEEGQLPRPAVSLPRGNGETILVVDDEPSILTLTRQTLEAFGYQVLTAKDGAEAVAIYAEHRSAIALVLTDMMMPVMGGASLIRVLRRINPKIKIAGASGLALDRPGIRALDPTVKHLLHKPYDAETLLATLRTMLDEA